MRALGNTPTQVAQSTYIQARLDQVQKLGSGFENPVQFFDVGNGPANIGATLTFQIFEATGVASIQILRNTAGDAGSAMTLQSYSAADLAVGAPISYYDNTPLIIGKKVWYWLQITPLNEELATLLQGPVTLQVPLTGSSLLQAPNDTSFTNTINFATVDSIVGGGSPTVRIYGPGGVGTSWTRLTGFGTTLTYAAGQITGLAFSTAYAVYWTGSAYAAFTTIPPTLPDNYVWAGAVTTVASGGGGGTSGGGGTGGGSGGRYTPL